MSALIDVVIPTVGRPSLGRLLAALGDGEGPALGDVIVVDDRPAGSPPLGLPGALAGARSLRVVRGRAAGPASARNVGWRLATAPWVAFLDDDVVTPPAWRTLLQADLADLPDDVAGSQGTVRVPRPAGRPPTDWERNVIGLEQAHWATADMAYRREALAALGGFDERFTRAYREDADLALRAIGEGRALRLGRRHVIHPVGPAPAWASVRAQAGNADDVLMRALHGRGWRARAGAHRGRRAAHLATAALGATALVAAVTGRRRLALAAGANWAALTTRFAWQRIAPGPRTPREVALMAATSAVIPFAAAWHTGRGLRYRRRLLRDRVRAPRPAPPHGMPVAAVLFDRDGTLVEDVPYNGDPARVRPLTGAAEALGRLHGRGLATAVISNQSGVARGLLTPEAVTAVNDRITALIGDPGPWLVCYHGPDDGCGCRKPQPGMVIGAARALGVDPRQCVVVGDIGADVEAAQRAGARAILVPTARTRPEEVRAAPLVARDLLAAVDVVLGSAP